MSDKRVKVIITREIKTSQGYTPPMNEFLEFLQIPLENIFSKLAEENQDYSPVKIHFKIIGPPIITEHDFDNVHIVSRDMYNRNSLLVRAKLKDSKECWKGQLIFENDFYPIELYSLIKNNILEYINRVNNGTKMVYVIHKYCLIKPIIENEKALTQIKICEKALKNLIEPPNLYRFCHFLGSKESFTKDELHEAIKKELNQDFSGKIMETILCNLIIFGLFDPAEEESVDEFYKTIFFLENADSYLIELEKEKIAKIEQQKFILNGKIESTQKEITRLENQLTSKRTDLQKLQTELEKFIT